MHQETNVRHAITNSGAAYFAACGLKRATARLRAQLERQGDLPQPHYREETCHA
jgi:hypothetical protein